MDSKMNVKSLGGLLEKYSVMLKLLLLQLWTSYYEIVFHWMQTIKLKKAISVHITENSNNYEIPIKLSLLDTFEWKILLL